MKNPLVIGIIALLVLSLGCISVKMDHTINRDGSSELKVNLAVSEKYQKDASSLFEGACERVDKDKVSDCKDSKDSLELTYNYEPEDEFYDFEVRDNIIYKEYEVTIKGLPGDQSANDYNMKITPFKKISDIDYQTIKSLGITYEYTLHMPGEITSYSAGELQDDGSLKVNMIDYLRETDAPIQVVSKEYNLIPIGVIVLAALAGIAWIKR